MAKKPFDESDLFHFVRLIAETGAAPENSRVCFVSPNPAKSYRAWIRFLNKFQLMAPHDTRNFTTYGPDGKRIVFITLKTMQEMKGESMEDSQSSEAKNHGPN